MKHDATGAASEVRASTYFEEEHARDERRGKEVGVALNLFHLFASDELVYLGQVIDREACLHITSFGKENKECQAAKCPRKDFIQS